MTSRLLTIVIPTRNRPESLELCLRSVFERQPTFPNVIVSDNSTSNQPGVEVLKKRYRFSYIRQSGRLSMTDHHNACLKLASTPWVLLLHDDDELYPDVLGKLESFLKSCNGAGIVVGGIQTISEDGVPHGHWIPKTSATLKGEDGVLYLGLDFRCSPPGCIWNIRAFHEVGGFPDAYGASADYPLVLRLAYSHGVTLFPELVGRYRIGAQQASDYSLEGAERILDCTIRMSELTRAIGCSADVTDRLVDYNNWWVFRIIAGRWFSSYPFFVSKLCQKCLLATPPAGQWKNVVKQEYPFLFLRPRWLVILLYKLSMTFIPAFVRRRLWRYCRAWLRP